MALIRGTRGLFPCPICLVPNEKQADYTTVYPLRTTEATKEAIYQARSKSSEKASEAILKKMSLRNVDVRI